MVDKGVGEMDRMGELLDGPVFAYCAASFGEATQRASGVPPLISPPISVSTFNHQWLEGKKLLYFDLHGSRGQPYWFGDAFCGIPSSGFDAVKGRCAALDVEIVRKADLRGTVVFATNCYLAEKDSPMLDAFLKAGAKYVVGGDGENWAPGAGDQRMYGAHMLGLWFRRFLVGAGLSAPRALALAKKMVGVQLRMQKGPGKRIGTKKMLEASKDTLEFRVYRLKG